MRQTKGGIWPKPKHTIYFISPGLLGFDLTDLRKADEGKWELSFDALFARNIVKLKVCNPYGNVAV